MILLSVSECHIDTGRRKREFLSQKLNELTVIVIKFHDKLFQPSFSFIDYDYSVNFTTLHLPKGGKGRECKGRSLVVLETGLRRFSPDLTRTSSSSAIVLGRQSLSGSLSNSQTPHDRHSATASWLLQPYLRQRSRGDNLDPKISIYKPRYASAGYSSSYFGVGIFQFLSCNPLGHGSLRRFELLDFYPTSKLH